MTETSDAFHQIAGHNVFCRRWHGPDGGAKPPVLLLHDSLGCTQMWRGFPAALCARLGRDVIGYDRIGFGRSALQSDPISLDFIAEEGREIIPALLDALGLERVVLFGHSVGGSMAVAAAGQGAAAIQSVITLSAPAFVEQRTVDGITAALAFFQMPENFARLEKYHGAKAGWVLNAWTETWRAEAFRDWSLVDALRGVRVPLLAIHGDSDEYGSRAFPELLAREAGGEMVMLNGVGHVPFREAPDAVLDAAAGFLG